ncbi:uncharacterized protein LOC115021758 isoform X2 [Cottoperca gobio]|uniref:Uncharacterized protein LOC115021758 isoform X2 n=1 Tax=Cottoperca gobio TaxID=56716 RepID=A0A6J2RDL3_COTGO|nr:uncharacterized protein LOC115021758 isoform X2 [Cottoperca gobio]
MAIVYPQGVLLLFLLIDISASRDGSPGIETVITSQEEDVVLPCADSWSEMDRRSCIRVRLIKYATDGSQMKVILTRPKTHKFQDAERVKWQDDGNGQMSLFLTKSQKSDEGVYGCEIWCDWDFISVKNVSLKVKDCKALLPVKAAPSTPANLNCPVDITSGQQGPQNISWAMMKGGSPAAVNFKRVEMNGTSLAIQSVNNDDSSWYRCNYTLGQTHRCFDIKLLVQEVEHAVVATTAQEMTTSENILKGKKEGSSGSFMVVVVTSVLVGIAIMAALIGVFIYRRRNTQRVIQQTLRHPAVTLTESSAGYEIVNFTLSEDRTNHRVNSLYQQLPDEGMCTFQH